jgi:hypothetical protein
LNAVDRNMSVVSEKLLCHFCTLKRKRKQSLLEFSSTYSNANKTPFCTSSFLSKAPGNLPPVNQESTGF